MADDASTDIPVSRDEEPVSFQLSSIVEYLLLIVGINGTV